MKGVPSYTCKEDRPLIDLLVEAGICSSKREAREFITNGTISVNGEKVLDLDFIVSKENAFGKCYTVIRRGKKKYYLIEHA